MNRQGPHSRRRTVLIILIILIILAVASNRIIFQPLRRLVSTNYLPASLPEFQQEGGMSAAHGEIPKGYELFHILAYRQQI